MQHQHLTIKKWALEDRPREKMQLKGITALSNAELCAILIGSGTRDESAVDVAKRVMQNADNDLFTLGQFSFEEFKKIKGIGPAKAISLMAALEIGRRRTVGKKKETIKITASSDVHKHMFPYVADLPHEEFWVLYLRRNNTIIATERVSIGGVSGTVIDVKIISKRAIELLASALILVHNHPSGNKNPSEADKNITCKMKETAQLFDCAVLDHVIVAVDTYFSFADEGLI
ncbi:MAG: DNA repair protein RadC [Bacteroidales bacterium]